MFGDDRVRGTREQVMMQVELVRLSCGERMIMGSFLYVFLVLFEMGCTGSWNILITLAVLYLWTYW